MTTYRIGFHKNNLPGRADSLDEARKIAVKIYNGLSPLDRNVAGTILRIYKGQKEHAQVLLGGTSAVDSQGNSVTTRYAYHVNRSRRVPWPFDPKTGRLI
ncbi:MAG: hypothetical protein IIY21_06105 [Clostridiales bacterium]|nr:hypothetical protein [Clostridiales bacterium]